jgi:Uma2 family endonuclease
MVMVAVTRRHFTADEYEQMGQAGILQREDRVELIDGEVVTKMTVATRHAAVVARLNHRFVLSTGGHAIVRVQLPVRLDRFNEPEPDLALLRPQRDFYETAHPGPSDILLVVEVAESSIRYDRTVKARLYARMRVAEYWLVDLNVDVVTRYTEPGEGRYLRADPVVPGPSFAPLLLPACVISTAAIFG